MNGRLDKLVSFEDHMTGLHAFQWAMRFRKMGLLTIPAAKTVKKTGDMATGSVSFHNERVVRSLAASREVACETLMRLLPGEATLRGGARQQDCQSAEQDEA